MVGAARGDVLEEVEIEMEPYLTTITVITIMSKFEFCLEADPETWILVHIVHLGGPGKSRLPIQGEMTCQHPPQTTVLHPPGALGSTVLHAPGVTPPKCERAG